ncbi:uncharacterized protein LOC110092911 [Dendrobium catenatum]|uniref:uncharacterized protein LOC110092911 n=1 Tax=Dendrobium catenatum TaxID=906689 RepID=UPI0009F36635|nr:uncharacterized protein LOC110092911 [Dendrobium catenatum]
MAIVPYDEQRQCLISQFLGIQVSHTSAGILLHQTQYALDLVASAGLQHSKPTQTPVALRSTPTAADSALYPDSHHYRQLAGSLNYLTITRPDIDYAVNCICQKMHRPTMANFIALKRLLRYVQDWAGDTRDRKSLTGFCTYLGTSLVSWCVKKQATVTKSSTEAEYRALSSATSDVIWLRRLLADFHIILDKPTPIFCDNTSAIALAHNPVFHTRTKHIEIDYQFIRHHIDTDAILIHHINSEDQPADILTKPLSSSRFTHLRTKLSIRS